MVPLWTVEPQVAGDQVAGCEKEQRHEMIGVLGFELADLGGLFGWRQRRNLLEELVWLTMVGNQGDDELAILWGQAPSRTDRLSRPRAHCFMAGTASGAVGLNLVGFGFADVMEECSESESLLAGKPPDG